MTFAVTLYLTMEAVDVEEALEIVDTIELKGKDDERIRWNSLLTEVQRIPAHRLPVR